MTVSEAHGNGRCDPIFDPFFTTGSPDPYPAYARLREEFPVYHVESRDIWAISRYEDVQAASRDSETFSNRPSVDLDDTHDVFGPGAFIDLDPPRHDVLRDVVRRSFAPKEIAASWPPAVERTVDRLLEGIVEGGSADLAADLAWPVPIALLCDLMGFPEADRPELGRLLTALIAREPGVPRAPRAARDAGDRLRNYFASAIADRGRHPREDLLSQIAEAARAGTLDEEEATGMCFLLCDAGTSTTASLISNAFWLLARHPDQRRLLAGEPARMPQAIEEILRFESPVQYLGRQTARDAEVRGTTIPEGARVALLFGSANRDPARFEAPDVFDVERAPKRHLAFGEGIHFCLGAPLARLEGRIVLERTLSALGEYELDEAEAVRSPLHTTRGFVRLPAGF